MARLNVELLVVTKQESVFDGDVDKIPQTCVKRGFDCTVHVEMQNYETGIFMI